MQRDDWDLSPDSVQRALDHLVPPSSGKVVREAFYGTRRFDDFVRRTGLTAPALSTRLKELEARGIVERRPYRADGARTRDEYLLTTRGRDLAVAVIALLDWADRWLPGPQGPTVRAVHGDCGAAVHPVLRCDAGHDEIAVVDVAVEPGPGAQRAGSGA